MFISVVIPCYNAAKTIVATLDNLVKELDGSCEYEIVVVNDGSTDNSAEIITGKAFLNKSVRLVDKVNGGVSSARNYGLKEARGEYIWFFDADDLCFEGSVSRIVTILQKSQPDICNFWSRTVDAHTKNAIDGYNNSANFKVLFEGKLKDWQSNRSVPFSCWASIVRRSLLIDNSIEFNSQLSISEDVLWNLEIASKCPDAHYIATNLMVVKYMLNPEGAVNSLDRRVAKRQLLSYLAFANRLSELDKSCPQYLRTAIGQQNSELGRKLVTRLLSSRTGYKESKLMADKVTIQRKEKL